jgi:cell fate regulator YaaT (PSP1 superfamily)
MASVVGVRFRRAGNVYYFDPGELDLQPEEWLVVETAHGPALGRVVITPAQVISSGLNESLKPVLRKALLEDVERAGELEKKEQNALEKCGELIKEMNIPMKVIFAESNLSGNYMTIFFRSEERVDFRDLVKQLSNSLKTRVELRQAGPRDAARLLGGIGRCGRVLCCASFLANLDPVSIKMAKDQNLPLNPSKISGVCGRLLCCLNYEVDFYRSMKEKMPSTGRMVATPLGEATVVGINPLKGTVLVRTESASDEVPLADIRPLEATPSEVVEIPTRGTALQRKRRRRKKKKVRAAEGTQDAASELKQLDSDH